MLSLSQLRNGCYDILRETEGDSNAYPVFFFNDLINNIYFNIMTGGVQNVFTGELIKRQRLPFNETSVFYTNNALTSLSVACSSGDDEIYCDTTNYASEGILYISGNIVSYTGKTDNSFTGVTGLEGNFEAGTNVSVLFELPSDCSDVLDFRYNYSCNIEPKNYLDIFKETLKNTSFYNSNTISDVFYSIIKGKYVILFNRNNYGDNIEIIYNKKPTLLQADTDEIIIPDDVYGNAIKYITIGEMLYNRGEEVRAKEVYLFGIGRLKEMYNFYNNTSNGRINNKSFGMGKYNHINI